ncbi:MAG: hypothetical protein GX801_06595 [Fibrobacter sp.]|nr:hypothetical protein [Fibrobacter sp.]
MASARSSRAILRKYSKGNLFFKLLLICAFLAGGIWVRLNFLEAIWVNTHDIYPFAQNQSIVWFHKGNNAKKSITNGDVVLFSDPKANSMIRVVAANSGQTLEVKKGATLTNQNFSLELQEDSWFLTDLNLKIPQKGDIWQWKQLELWEFDLAYKIFKQQKPTDSISLKLELLINGNLVDLNKVGSVQMYNLPISATDLVHANWQELYIAQLQLKLADPVARQVQFRRSLWQNDKEITQIIFDDDYFWLSCTKALNCSDSRDFGLIGMKNIKGKAGQHSLKLFLNK